MAKDNNSVIKEDSFSVNVAPEMQLYHVLHHLNYGLETAFAEFIDNSIQSFIENEEKIAAIKKKKLGDNFKENKLDINIIIDTQDNTISIKDDAFGIDRSTMHRALRLGNSRVGFHPKDSLSVYGIGMKSSAIWFSEVWQIETTALGSSDKLIFDFNLEELIENGKDEADVRIESESDDNHYTKIVLKNHVRNESIEYYEDNVLPYLMETFQKFSSKVRINIFYDGKMLIPNQKKILLSTPDVLVYPPVDKRGVISKDIVVKWVLSIDFEYLGRDVKGYIMLRSAGSYSQPGIRLIRNGRVIEGTTVYPNIPNVLLGTKNKYAAQRLYGELDISNFPVDFMKTNFNENLNGFYSKLRQEIAKNQIGNLIDQATYYRKKLVEKGPNQSLSDELNKKGQIITLDCDGPLEINDVTPPPIEKPRKKPLDENPVIDSPDDGTVKGDENGGGGTQGLVDIYKPDPSNQLPRSDEIDNALTKLNEGKLFNLYESLCTVSLKRHSVMCYVSAWCLVEAVTARVGRPSNNDFIGYLGSKVTEYSGKDKRLKGELNNVIKDISSRGNTTKHSGTFWNTDALDLKNHFKILAPFIEWLVEEHFEE